MLYGGADGFEVAQTHIRNTVDSRESPGESDATQAGSSRDVTIARSQFRGDTYFGERGALERQPRASSSGGRRRERRRESARVRIRSCPGRGPSHELPGSAHDPPGPDG